MKSIPSAPVIRYHGAKFRLAPWVISHFPQHNVYVESFGGAAGVLMQKPRCAGEVYNDLDDDIVNLMRILRDPEKREALAEACVLRPFARSEFVAAYEFTSDELERARRTIVRATMGFGSAGATKGSSGFRVDSRRSYGTASHVWAKYPDTIASIGHRFAGVIIENRPAVDVMLQHDGHDSLHYVDPPYLHATRSMKGRAKSHYYRHELTDADHAALLVSLRDLKGFVVLSGYSSELYCDLLPDWACNKTTSRISASRGTTVRQECLWLNPACVEALNAQGLFGKHA